MRTLAANVEVNQQFAKVLAQGGESTDAECLYLSEYIRGTGECKLTLKDVCQCFVLKLTFSINKKAVLGPFCWLLNKAKFMKPLR